MEVQQAVPEFGYATGLPAHTVAYLRTGIMAMLPPLRPGARVLDIGCGNGFWAGQLAKAGYEAVGIDPSAEGIAIARTSHPNVRFEQTIVTEDLLERIGGDPFDAIISVEVVEHLYDPRSWARGAFAALKPGGRLVCTTPYHGYFKNMALALFNKWDRHLNPLWDGGHIKFWSRSSLGRLLSEGGFTNIQFRGAGRLPYVWMSMIMSGDRPTRT